MGEGAYCVMHQCGVSMGKLCMPCERLFCMNEIKYSSLKKRLEIDIIFDQVFHIQMYFMIISIPNVIIVSY